MGNGYFRAAREFAVRRADVEGLSGSAHAVKELGRTDENRGVEDGTDGCAGAAGDHFATLYGTPGLRQLRHLFRIWLPSESALEFGGGRYCRCHKARPWATVGGDLPPRN